MRRRINITVSDETIRLLDRVAKKGDRSRVIAEAVTRYVTDASRKRLRAQLKEGARANAERDLLIAEEWAHPDEETWEQKRKG